MHGRRVPVQVSHCIHGVNLPSNEFREVVMIGISIGHDGETHFNSQVLELLSKTFLVKNVRKLVLFGFHATHVEPIGVLQTSCQNLVGSEGSISDRPHSSVEPVLSRALASCCYEGGVIRGHRFLRAINGHSQADVVRDMTPVGVHPSWMEAVHRSGVMFDGGKSNESYLLCRRDCAEACQGRLGRLP